MFPDERRSRVLQRLLRRRANRLERNLPASLEQPVPPGSMDEPLPPAETTATGPRPLTASVAAALLAVLGASLAVTITAEMVPAILEILAMPTVDDLTTIVHWIVAAFLAGVLAALLGIAGLQVYAAWRVARGVNWGWVEGLAVAIMGTLASGVAYGVDADGGIELTLGLAVAVGGYVVAIASLIVARPWFGEIRLPLRPDRGPWWLRLRHPRWP